MHAAIGMAMLLFAQDAQVQTQRQHEPATGFLYRTLHYQRDVFAYTIFVPPAYDPQTKWPVILFLHGSGERGEDGFLPSEVGIGRAIRRNYKRCPAVVVMPQCRSGQLWRQPMLDMALRCVQQTSMSYNLDPDRFYVTGLSMGGAGAWELAASAGDRLAAVAPVCGFVDNPQQPPGAEVVADMAGRVGDLPIWCFHGSADLNVVADQTRAMVSALRARGRDVQYTEYEGAKHGIWDRVYGDQRFWDWLLAQRRGQAASQPSSSPSP